MYLPLTTDLLYNHLTTAYINVIENVFELFYKCN